MGHAGPSSKEDPAKARPGRPVAALLVFTWFVTSIYFNNLTPDFQLYLTENLDITMVELFSATAYGLLVLPLFGLTVLPPREMFIPMLKIGLCHLVACRLFIIAVCGQDSIPVSLAQTIRAASPVFMVIVSFLYSRQRYSSKLLISLIPLIVGFGIASLSEVSMNLVGFMAAVGSVTTLVILSLISKDQFSAVDQQPPHWGQVQLWSCAMAAVIQSPTWAADGGVGRVVAAFDDTAFLRLVLLNGAMYYAEQVMQFQAIQTYQPLSYSVIDTLRRLTIVVVTGFVLRGDSFNLTKCIGILIVCCGAVYYNMTKTAMEKASVGSLGKTDSMTTKKCQEPVIADTSVAAQGKEKATPVKLSIAKLAKSVDLTPRRRSQRIASQTPTK